MSIKKKNLHQKPVQVFIIQNKIVARVHHKKYIGEKYPKFKHRSNEIVKKKKFSKTASETQIAF